MEKEKLQKVAWGILSFLVIAWFLCFKAYNYYTVSQTNKFVDAYNSFVAAENSFSVAIQMKVDENGKLKNPSDIDTLISKTEDLAKNKCNLLKVEEVKKDCISVFTEYTALLNDVKVNWFSEDNAKKLETHDNALTKLEEVLSTKVWIKFQ